CLMSVLSH
ncbi:peptide-methionine (S)-S-oxide reductase, partial [Vibrio parahaemolyticus V-223/04]